MTPLRKICFVQKGYNIKKHIDEYKDLYPTEFTIVELDPEDITWYKKGKYYVLDNDFVDSYTKGYEDHDIASFFINDWKQGKRALRGYHTGRNSNTLEANFTRFRHFYHGTAEHEDLHAMDNLIQEYGGVLLETIFNVDDFDDDVVHRRESRVFYNFDDVWEKLAPYLSHALAVKRARSKPQKPKKTILPTSAKRSAYRPENFTIAELVPPHVLNRLGEELCWSLLDERLLMNLQWLRDRFGVTYVNIRGRFEYRGFDDGTFRNSGTSQHNHGRAIDCHFKDYTIPQVHEILEKEYTNMPEPNIWVEKQSGGKLVTWLHLDVRYSDITGLNFFNA